MDDILNELFKLQDKKYADFQYKLTPTASREKIIGVRVPEIRKLAKKCIKNGKAEDFLNHLPHCYYDENMLHSVLISEIKDYDSCIKKVDDFLPYVDNWAVCDIISPKVFKKHKDKLIEKIKEWSSSSKTYTCRFGLEMLMSHYLDDTFKKEYLEIPAAIISDAYYVQMMLAWFFATALAKQWDDTVIYLNSNRLNKWLHNKTIQKAKESRRITIQQKEYLEKLKR